MTKNPLFAPVDAASLVFFRMIFAAVMIWEVRLFLGHGWVREYWIEPAFHFTYLGFGWVRPWPGSGMYVHFLALGLLALLILAGLCYRVAALLFFLGFIYVFLLEQAQFLNHFYLVCLIGFLLIFIPAHRAFSIDAWLRPELRSRTVPAWCLWLLRAQIGIPYFYGGLAKVKGDWLRGEPMRLWLGDAAGTPGIGSFFTEEWVVYLFSYGGLLFDLMVVPLLLWRRTRPYAYLTAVLFHLMNATLFSLGIFPWLMIAATTVFLSPSWPRRLLGRVWPEVKDCPAPQPAEESTAARRRLALVSLGVYLTVQLLVPLRHFLYPGSVIWTEEGQRFAWHMRLRDKWALGDFVATDTLTGETRVIEPWDHLPAWQATRMLISPDMILQFSHFIADEMRREGHPSVEVRARIECSLNGRRRASLVDPEVDLASQPRDLMPASWILPLDVPLGERPGSQRATPTRRDAP